MIKKYYWLLAGIFVGIYTVLTAYYNMIILVGSGDLTVGGSLVVIVEYTLLIVGLGWLEKNFVRKSKK